MVVDDAVQRLHRVRAVEEHGDVADPELSGRRRARRSFDRPDADGEPPTEVASRGKHAGISCWSAARNRDGNVPFRQRSQRHVCSHAVKGIDRPLDLAEPKQGLGQLAPSAFVVRPHVQGVAQGVACLAERTGTQPCRAEVPPRRMMAIVGGDQPAIGVGRLVHRARHEQRLSRFDVRHSS